VSKPKTVDPHKNYRSDWQTDPAWSAWARDTLGGTIDLDPCAPPRGPFMANRYYCGPDGEENNLNGLTSEWHGAVYCNPPGSQAASVGAWWQKAIDEVAAGRCTALVFCFFNWEAAVTVPNAPLHMCGGYLVLPRRRVPYWRDGKLFKSPRNRTAFWSSVYPSRDAPDEMAIIETGNANVVEAACAS
jgi:hypothetical protein